MDEWLVLGVLAIIGLLSIVLGIVLALSYVWHHIIWV